ncbi:hypothetical protein W02_05170 [Nitrospira sp. KM1]|uniref:DUF748 domain-containing protein n=1 Tax=Nitrospira sp. KM1 TaxID=1936990 RepID=UPI0013A721E1|nr:DUF748 domain-containing protein [Nitrospira sp. KM1]BCA53377.1 hypothetical protein W02_05170 [Nitrospira sp. KM1]
MRKLFRPIPLAVLSLTFLLLYALAGFFLLPYIIQAYVFPKVSEQLQRPVFAREVAVNPFELSLRLTGFQIQEQDASPLLGFEEFFVNFQAVSLVRRAYVFDTIRFTVPFVSVKIAKDGRVNIAHIVPPASEPAPAQQEPKPASEIPAVQIGRFEIEQGVVEFLDETKKRPFSLDIVPINIVLNDFHTKPGGENTYAFTAELGKDKTLSWEGRASLEPLESEGKLSFRGLQLPVLWKYVQDTFRFALTSGTFEVDGRYRFDAGTSPPEIVATEGSIRVANLSIQELEGVEPVISIPSIAVDGIHLDVRQRTVDIPSVKISDAVWLAWLNADKTVNYQSLFAPVPSEPSPTALEPPSVTTSEPPARPWTVTLHDASLENHTVRFEDRSLPTVMHTEITNLSVHTHDVTIPLSSPVPLSVDMTVNQSGKLKLTGEVAVNPVQASFALSLKQIALKPFEPYIEPFARIVVESGELNMDGKVRFAQQHANAPMLTYAGNLGLRGLAIAEREDGTPLLSWKQLQFKQIDLAVAPTEITVEEIGLDQPVVRLAVLPDGQLNVSRIQSRSPEKAAASQKEKIPPPAQHPPSTTVGIKTVKLLKGQVLFQDESLQPTARIGIYDLTGTVKGLSSKQVAKADVNISGRVDKVAPLKIAGTINPLSEETATDLTVKFDNVDLTAATSYSGKYAGYPIKKGKLFLNLAYKVSQKHLEAENAVTIDQLTFGDKTDSPDATSLPVPFAVALLKDRKGKIEIDLPIRGDLNDPDFKYGKVLLSTLVNLMAKLVASPFALAGKLIPGGEDGEELQFFEFSPGSAISPDQELKKTEAITKALLERPGLRLEITGAVDPTRDHQALGMLRLAAQVQTLWNKERGKSPSNAQPVPVEEEQHLVKNLYDQLPGVSRDRQAPTPSNQAIPPPSLAEMKRALVASMPPDEEALRALAQQRAEEIRTQLTGEGKLPEERVYMTEVDINATGHDQIRSRLAITAAP